MTVEAGKRFLLRNLMFVACIKLECVHKIDEELEGSEPQTHTSISIFDHSFEERIETNKISSIRSFPQVHNTAELVVPAQHMFVDLKKG